ncbi:hypothetical protein T484DRAFT_1813330 [Baffinella frigidus]|nr:hypothetical protein T484DRAFT_1813330 [Cryptophyta sp. CCMP2293]
MVRRRLSEMLSDMSVERASRVARMHHLEATIDRPLSVAEREQKRMEERTGVLLERLTTIRNAVDRIQCENQINRFQQDIKCIERNLNRSAFIVVSGTLEMFLRIPTVGTAGKKGLTAATASVSNFASMSSKKGQEQQFTEVPVGKLGAGDCFGDLTLLVNAHRDVAVRAISECRVMEWTRESLAPILARQADLEKRAGQMSGLEKRAGQMHSDPEHFA